MENLEIQSYYLCQVTEYSLSLSINRPIHWLSSSESCTLQNWVMSSHEDKLALSPFHHKKYF